MQDNKPVPPSQRHICEYLAKVQVSIKNGSGGQDEINSSTNNNTGSSIVTGKHSCHFLKLASVEKEDTSHISDETEKKKVSMVDSEHRCQFVSVDRGGSPVKSSQESNVEASSTPISANSHHNCPYLAKVQSILKSLEDSSSNNQPTRTKLKDLESSEKHRPWIKQSSGNSETSAKDYGTSAGKKFPFQVKFGSPDEKGVVFKEKDNPSAQREIQVPRKREKTIEKREPPIYKNDPLTDKADKISSINTETQKEFPGQKQHSCSSLDATKHACYFLEVAKRGLEKLNEASKKSGSEKQPFSVVTKESGNLTAIGERNGISNEKNRSTSDQETSQRVQRVTKENKSIPPEEQNRFKPELRPSAGSSVSRSSTRTPSGVDDRNTKRPIDPTTTGREQRITDGDKDENYLGINQKMCSENIPRINISDKNTTTKLTPEISKSKDASKQADSIPKVSCHFLHREKDSSTPREDVREIVCEYLDMSKLRSDSPRGETSVSGKISKSPNVERTESSLSSNSTPVKKSQCSYLNCTSNVQAHSCEYIRQITKHSNSSANEKNMGKENAGEHESHTDVITKCEYLEISKEPKLDISKSFDKQKHSRLPNPQTHRRMETAIDNNKPELDYSANNRYRNIGTNYNGGDSIIEIVAKDDLLSEHSSSIRSSSTPASKQLWKQTSSSCTNLESISNHASHQTTSNHLIPVTTSNHSGHEVASNYQSPTSIGSQSWKQTNSTYKNRLTCGNQLGLQGASTTASPVTIDGKIQEIFSFPVTKNQEPSVSRRDFKFSKTEPLMNYSFENLLRNDSSAKDVHTQRSISSKIALKYPSQGTSSPQNKTKNPLITKQSNRNYLQYTKRLCTVMTRNEVNNSNKQFLVKLAKYGKETSSQMDNSDNHFLRTNRILHAACSFEIWNYVDINKKSFRGRSPFNYSRLKTERRPLGDPSLTKDLGTSARKEIITRGAIELNHNQNFMTSANTLGASGRNSYDVTNSQHQPKESSTISDKMSSNHLPRASLTSTSTLGASGRHSYDINTSQHQPKESCNTSHQSRATAKKERRRKSKKKNKGTNDPISSDIEDLEMKDRDLLNSISPFSDCSRPSDLDLSRIQE